MQGLCVTKLDVLDGLDTIKICTGYTHEGHPFDPMVMDGRAFSQCQPVYLELEGWHRSTSGATKMSDLPKQARAYLDKIHELSGVQLDLISTGPDRRHSIVCNEVY